MSASQLITNNLQGWMGGRFALERRGTAPRERPGLLRAAIGETRGANRATAECVVSRTNDAIPHLGTHFWRKNTRKGGQEPVTD